jgi:hypothetical protein
VGLLINQLVPATVLSLLKIAFFKEKLLNWQWINLPNLSYLASNIVDQKKTVCTPASSSCDHWNLCTEILSYTNILIDLSFY